MLIKKVIKKMYSRELVYFFLVCLKTCQKKVLALPRKSWIRCMVFPNMI